MNKPISKYSQGWTARIDLLKKSLDSEALYQRRASSEDLARERAAQAPLAVPGSAEDIQKLSENYTALCEEYKKFREVSAHEIRMISKRCQEMESFVKAKEIDLQNLKSEMVALKLIETEHFEKLEAQGKKSGAALNEMEGKIQDLTGLITALKKQLASRSETVEVQAPVPSAPPAARRAPIQPPAFESEPFAAPEIPTPSMETHEVPIVYMTEEKPLLKRWLDWWNEPVTKVSLNKKDSEE